MEMSDTESLKKILQIQECGKMSSLREDISVMSFEILGDLTKLKKRSIAIFPLETQSAL